jgi:two-component system NarL family sensor kinase
MRPVYILLLAQFHFFCCPSIAQVSDSITKRIQQIRSMPLDTAQVNQLRATAHNLIEQDKELSRQLLKEALDKSLKVGERDAITNCYRMMGLWYSSFEQYEEALQYYRLSYESARKNNNVQLQAGVLYNMGNIKYWKSAYDSCIYFYQQSQHLLEDPDFVKKAGIPQNKADVMLSDLYRNLSTVFSTVKNLPKADEYIDKAIRITSNYTSRRAQENLAEYMMQKAGNFYDNGETAKALRLRLQYLPVLEEKHFQYPLADAYYNISKEYLELDKMDSAEWYAGKQLALAQELEQESYLADAHLLQATIAVRKKEWAVADQHAQLAKPYYEQLEDLFEQNEFYRLMKEIAYARGRFQEAYDYYGKYDETKDSLQSSKRAITFSEMEMRYETEKKEARIALQQAELRQKNLYNYLLMGGAAALLVILVLLYRNYSSRRKIQQQRIQELEGEKQLLATQSLLKGQEEERSRLAQDLHDGLGGLLSGVKLQLGSMKGNLVMTESNSQAFERVLDKLDESITEMRRVAHNMMPEALLNLGLKQALSDYCENLSRHQSFAINCEIYGLENRMEHTVEVVIYRIIQELVNNAVKHSGGDTILVQVIRQDTGRLTVTVEDNGKGFDTTQMDVMRSAGMRSVQSRVNYLNGTMDIKSEPGKGTSVYLECDSVIV